MKPALFIRPLTDAERQALRQGLRSPDAFTLRRCQVLLASAAGQTPAAIAAAVGLSSQAVRDALRAFAAEGLACLRRKPPVPKQPKAAWDRGHDENLKDLLRRSPRDFGKPTSLWTLSPWTCREAPDCPGVHLAATSPTLPGGAFFAHRLFLQKWQSSCPGRDRNHDLLYTGVAPVTKGARDDRTLSGLGRPPKDKSSASSLAERLP
jgi:hypothetical protein